MAPGSKNEFAISRCDELTVSHKTDEFSGGRIETLAIFDTLY